MNELENMPLLALLSIFVIVVLAKCLKIFPTWRVMVSAMSTNSTKNLTTIPRASRSSEMDTEMSPKNIHCKACGRDFSRLGWMTNKECDIPEQCHCPEVKKAMAQANNVINKAKKQAGFKVEHTLISLPTQRDDQIGQYFIPIEPLVVINVIKQKG